MINLLDVIKKKTTDLHFKFRKRKFFERSRRVNWENNVKDECFDKLFQSLSRNKLD